MVQSFDVSTSQIFIRLLWASLLDVRFWAWRCHMKQYRLPSQKHYFLKAMHEINHKLLNIYKMLPEVPELCWKTYLLTLYNSYNMNRKYLIRSWDSVVGIATGYKLDDRGVGVWVPVGSRIFSKSSRPHLGSTRPPIQWVLRAQHEADHSPPASAEVKKMWIYTSTLTYAYMA
jgi:hypothetical protein